MRYPFIHSVETLSLHWSRMDENLFLDIQRLKRKLNNPGFLPSPKFPMSWDMDINRQNSSFLILDREKGGEEGGKGSFYLLNIT